MFQRATEQPLDWVTFVEIISEMWILAFAIGEGGYTAEPIISGNYLKDLSETLRKFVFIDCDRNLHLASSAVISAPAAPPFDDPQSHHF